MKILCFEKPTSLKSHGSITNIVIGVKIEGVSCFRTMLCLDTTALPCRARLPHPDPRCAPCAALSDILHTHTRHMYNGIKWISLYNCTCTIRQASMHITQLYLHVWRVQPNSWGHIRSLWRNQPGQTDGGQRSVIEMRRIWTNDKGNILLVWRTDIGC